PSSMYVIAAAPQIGEPVRYDQSRLPLVASNALKSPSWLPANTSPDAVDITPASDEVGKRNSHFISPVRASSARSALKSGSDSFFMPPPVTTFPVCSSGRNGV